MPARIASSIIRVRVCPRSLAICRRNTSSASSSRILILILRRPSFMLLYHAIHVPHFWGGIERDKTVRAC